MAGLLIAIHLVNILTGNALVSLGIYPRHFTSLPTILTAPLIHGSVGHLLNNLVPLLVLSFLLMLHSRQYFFRSVSFITVVCGALVWLFARNTLHVGASGVIFGLWALCLCNSYFSRSWKNFAITVLVFFLYGGMIFGIFPGQVGISYESHFFGAVAGILYAYLYRSK